MGSSNGLHDRFDDSSRFLKNLIVPKPQDTKSRCSQLPVTLHIGGRNFGVLPAVEFDHEPGFKRDKIWYEAVERMLTAEFDAKPLAAQVLPEQTLGIGSVVPKPLRNPVLPQPVVVLPVHALTHPFPGRPGSLCGVLKRNFPTRKYKDGRMALKCTGKNF